MVDFKCFGDICPLKCIVFISDKDFTWKFQILKKQPDIFGMKGISQGVVLDKLFIAYTSHTERVDNNYKYKNKEV